MTELQKIIKEVFTEFEYDDEHFITTPKVVELEKLLLEKVGQIEQTCKNCKFMFDDKYVDDCHTYECTKHNNTIFGGMFEDYWHDLGNIGCKQFEPKGEN